MQTYTPRQTHETLSMLETSRANKNPLPDEEGFLISHDIQVTGLEIADVAHSLDVDRTRYGTAFTDRYTMSNGIYYNVITLLPERIRTDVPLDIRTPWFTTERGHNRRTAEAASALGIPVRLFAPPRIDIDKRPWKFCESMLGALSTAQAISMDADIASYAMIANDSDSMHKNVFAPGMSMAYGESRGAMEGLGSAAVEKRYARRTLWLEAVDPCIPEELSVLDVIGNPSSLGEIVAAVKTIRHIMKEARFLPYLDTIDMRPDYLVPALATRKTLFSGRAGEYARNVSPTAHGHGTFFDSSIANGYDKYKQNLSHADGFSTELLKGAHLTLAAREIVYRSLARIVTVRDAIEKHGEDFAFHELEKIRAARPFHKTKIKTSERAA